MKINMCLEKMLKDAQFYNEEFVDILVNWKNVKRSKLTIEKCWKKSTQLGF